jgi:hypothetical protein
MLSKDSFMFVLPREGNSLPLKQLTSARTYGTLFTESQDLVTTSIRLQLWEDASVGRMEILDHAVLVPTLFRPEPPCRKSLTKMLTRCLTSSGLLEISVRII